MTPRVSVIVGSWNPRGVTATWTEQRRNEGVFFAARWILGGLMAARRAS